MPLTDLALRNAKAGPKPYKLSDSCGLFVQITPAGGKLWRLKYRFSGKEKLLSFGPYPLVSLAEAREQRDRAKKLLLAGVDPSTQRKTERASAERSALETFGVLANEFIAREGKNGRAAHTIAKLRWLLLDLAAPLENRPIRQVTPADILDVLRRIEARGLRESTRRCRATISRVFRYAITTDRATLDPTTAVKGEALLIHRARHHAALTKPKAVGELMRAIDGLEGSFVVRSALKLLAICYPRPGELRYAAWAEIDFEMATWTIPAHRMKMKKEHIIPLPVQAVTLFREVEGVTGGGHLLFPGIRTSNRPLSENTLNVALRRLGYTTDEMTTHGFRTTASTLLNESGLWHPDAIERSLAHVDRNSVRKAYARGSYWDERVRMAQWWADYLDDLRRSGN
jgi:integrase